MDKKCKNQEVAILVLYSALRKIYEIENKLSKESCKTIKDAIKLVNEIMEE